MIKAVSEFIKQTGKQITMMKMSVTDELHVIKEV